MHVQKSHKPFIPIKFARYPSNLIVEYFSHLLCSLVAVLLLAVLGYHVFCLFSSYVFYTPKDDLINSPKNTRVMWQHHQRAERAGAPPPSCRVAQFEIQKEVIKGKPSAVLYTFLLTAVMTDPFVQVRQHMHCGVYKAVLVLIYHLWEAEVYLRRGLIVL